MPDFSQSIRPSLPSPALELPILLDDRDEQKFVEHCGVCAVINSPSAVGLTTLGLSLLQHRGQDGAGIAVATPQGEIHKIRGEGKVREALTDSLLHTLPPSQFAIGHTRYGTSGGQSSANLQPLTLTIPHLGEVAIAHNGNLTNSGQLRQQLENEGCSFNSTSDTEVVLHLIAKYYSPNKSIIEVVECALSEITGSYSLLLLFQDRIVAARDPHGNRPLVIGKLDETVVITSEPCGWDSFKIYNFREIAPGQIVEFYPDGGLGEQRTIQKQVRPAPCLMELLYFARPDSIIFGTQVAAFRRKLGELLYKRHPVDADLVVPLMSSGLNYAQGFSEASGIPLRFSLTKNPTAARVFIEADHQARFQKTLEKHSLIREEIAGKRVVYIDDSIVRGVTLEQIVKLSFPAANPARSGAKEVHIRIGAPPIVGPCNYGISTPTPNELAVNRYGGYSGVGPVEPSKVEAIVANQLGATSVGFSTLADIANALGSNEINNCTSCFTNLYDRIC